MKHKVNKMALTLGIGFGLFAGTTIVLGETVHQMNERMNKTNEVLRDTKEIAKDASKQVQDLKKENKDLQSSNQELKMKTSKQENELKKLNESNKQKQEDIDNKANQIESKNSEIADLKKSIASRRAATSIQKTQEAKATPVKIEQKSEKVVAVKSTPQEKQVTPKPTSEKVQSPTPSTRSTSSYEATAYGNQSPSSPGGGVITATGTHVAAGRTIAVDPRHIPLGSNVRITVPGMPQYNGVYKAEDTGGAIKGRRIDIYVPGRQDAVDFGRRDIQVEVLG